MIGADDTASTKGVRIVFADQILANKGRDVATIAPEATVGEAVAELAEFNVGALVVSSDGVHLSGIISERDIVRALARDGSGVLERTIADLMQSDVATCDGHSDSTEMMSLMTERRFRHLPVIEDGQIVGIISIGDVVKVRIDELASEREELVGYIRQGR